MLSLDAPKMISAICAREKAVESRIISVGDSLPVGQLNSWYFNWYFKNEIPRQYSCVVRVTGIVPYQLGYQL
jgi:hypothetical protein